MPFSLKHWRERADEIRKLAADMKDESAKEIMLRLAREYEKLAGRGGPEAPPPDAPPLRGAK